MIREISIATPRDILRIAPRFASPFREIGLDAEIIFEHPQIVPWRKLSDRENCTLDATLIDGRKIRWHVKRYPAAPALGLTAAEHEVNGFAALNAAEIPSASVVGWGKLRDRRSFIITEDLADHRPADQSIADGFTPFERLLEPTADLAAKLHAANLHHRDLYLCHFFADRTAGDVRLIDVARVRRLPPITQRRWIVKDLAQFWFSSEALFAITDHHRRLWLERYAQQRGVDSSGLQSAIERKARSIARHDRQLRRLQPNRNISIPAASSSTPVE